MTDTSTDPRYHERGCPQHVHPTQRDPNVISICTCGGADRPLTSTCDECGTPLLWVDGVDGEPGEWEREPVDTTATNLAYRERNAVVSALIRYANWPSWIIPAPDAPGWHIVYAETPQGQVSWHIGPDDMDMFAGCPTTPLRPWDHHDTFEKYRRLELLLPDERLSR